MNIEAEIALAIVGKARLNGWLALSIHDAFIAHVSKEEELRTMMMDEYKSRFGYEPTITKK